MPVSLRDPHPFMVVALLLSCSTHSVSLPIADYNIPTYMYGPTFTNLAAVATLNSSYYNSSLPTLNLSWPVIKLAGVITTSGQYSALGTMFQSIYCFMVDMINAHGGIVVNGVPHLLSITWASDDSSMPYMEYLYTQWLNDPSYTAYIAPQQDPQLQSLNALIVGSNRTFLNTYAMASANFVQQYPYIFSAIQPRERVPVPSMDQLNLRAQQYHNDVNSGAKKPSYAEETTSQWGIQNVCMYTHNDPAQLLTCNGVRQWINATNQARLAAGATQDELLVVMQDVLWNIDPTAVQQDLYTSSFNLCPDHVDVLVVCGQTSVADTTAVSAALAATELRPKAAFTSTGLPAYTANNPQMATQWPGWATLTSPTVPVATLPAATFKTASQFKRDWAAFFNVSASTVSVQQVVYSTPLEIFKAALSTTTSLSSADLRDAFLSLNGTYNYGRPVAINAFTGVNDGSVTWIAQLSRTAGLVLASNTTQLVYPYDWPWSRLQVGNSLNVSQNSTNVIIGWVLVMLGCWVAQIVAEQAVFVRRRGGWYQLWLGVVATSLGGAGVWCSQWTMASAITLTRPTDGAALPISFSFDVAMLAMLPAITLTWCGLYVLMRDVEDNSAEAANRKHSSAHMARQINREHQAEKRKRAALSNKAHFHHLKDSMSRNVVGGAIFIALAVGVTRVTLWYNWSVQATIVSTASGWIVSVLVAIVLLFPALLMYFHALKWRTAAVFMLAGTVMVDWQVHVYTMTFKYALTVLATPPALYNTLLSPTGVQLITGIITAVTCFGFIGLQFSRMQLSRNGLSVLVASLENVINKHKSALQEEQYQSSCLRIQADELVRIIETINMVRPILKEYAWALASCSNASTFMQQHEQTKTASADLRHTSSAAVSTSEPASCLSGQQSTRRVSHEPTTVGEANVVNTLAQHSNNALDEDGAARPEFDEQQQRSVSSPQLENSGLHPSAQRLSGAIMNNTQVGWTDSQQRKAEVESLVQVNKNESDQGNGAVSKLHGSLVTTASRTRESSADSSSPTLVGAGDEPSKNNESIASMTGIGHFTHVDHGGRRKRSEVSLIALLNEQSQRFTVAALEHPHNTYGSHGSGSLLNLSGRNPSQSAEDLDFMVSAATTRGPTFVELLSHPVCVELLKDELERIHSVENLVFYLHASRYRQLHSSRARRLIATLIVDTFIAEGAPQQINISTRQRDAIRVQLKKRGDDVATPQLFCEAEREVALLMETNVMKTFTSTPAYRVCTLVLSAIDIDKATGRWAEQRKVDDDRANAVGRRVSLLASQHSSQLHDVEPNRTAPRL